MNGKSMKELHFFSDYIANKYGGKRHRIGIDLALGCPNRLNRFGPGCVYCAEDGNRARHLMRHLDLAGQVEAALSIGLTRGKTMRKIVLPQAVRYVIPSLIAQLVVVVKDTTVAYVVSFPDLMQNARVLITSYDALVSMYLVIAVIYILINYAINKASVYVAHRTGVKIIR